MWNLLQIQSRHHNFVLPIQRSWFLPASPQAAVKKICKTFKTESLWSDFFRISLTFSIAYSMKPFSHSTASGSPERGSDELSLEKRFFYFPKYSQLLLFKTWATKCWDNQWHWSASLDPPYQTCSQTTRPGCRRDWMFFVFFFRYLGFYLHSVGSLSHALKAALM